MRKQSKWILLSMTLLLVLGYFVIDIQYKPDLTAFAQGNGSCAIDATLKDILPQETVLAKNPFGRVKALPLLNASGEVIDLNTPLVELIDPEDVQQFMTRLNAGLDSKPLELEFYVAPIFKLQPVQIFQTIKAENVSVEPIVLNFKTDVIPEHYLFKYQGRIVDGPINPKAGTDDFNLFRVVGQDFIREDYNNVYYIDIQDKRVFEPAYIEKSILKGDGDQADSFCRELLDDALNSIPLKYRFFALQKGLSVRWRDMLKMTDEDIRLHNGSYNEDTVKSAKEYSDTIIAYYNSSIHAIEFNNNQGYEDNFSNLFKRNDWYYIVHGDQWNKSKEIYSVAELKVYALRKMKSNFAHEFGHL